MKTILTLCSTSTSPKERGGNCKKATLMYLLLIYEHNAPNIQTPSLIILDILTEMLLRKQTKAATFIVIR